MLSSILIITLLLLFICIVNGVYTYLVGDVVDRYTTTKGKLLFWTGFWCTVISIIINFLFMFFKKRPSKN